MCCADQGEEVGGAGGEEQLRHVGVLQLGRGDGQPDQSDVSVECRPIRAEHCVSVSTNDGSPGGPRAVLDGGDAPRGDDGRPRPRHPRAQQQSQHLQWAQGLLCMLPLDIAPLLQVTT